MPLKTVNLFFTSFICIFLLFSQSLRAATISQLKGNKVLINNDDDEIQIGQEFYIIDKNNKKTGSLIKITTVRGEKSIALITRGNVLPNQTLLLKPMIPSLSSAEIITTENPVKKTKEKANLAAEQVFESDENLTPLYRNSSKKIGVLLNMMFNSMSAKESDGVAPTPNTENVSMTGTSIGLTGSLDYPVKPWLDFRGTAGYEPFIVSNTASIKGCDNTTTTNCNTNINYLVAGGYGRINLYQKSALNLWTGLGINFRFPISKSSTAVRTSDLNLTTSYGLVGGGEYFFNYKEFIPFSIEQQFFKSSDTVTANLFSFRVGYGLSY